MATWENWYFGPEFKQEWAKFVPQNKDIAYNAAYLTIYREAKKDNDANKKIFPKSLKPITPEKLVSLFRKRYVEEPNAPELPAGGGFEVFDLRENNTPGVTAAIHLPTPDTDAGYADMRPKIEAYAADNADQEKQTTFKKKIIIFYCWAGQDRSPRAAYFYRKAWEKKYGADAANGPVVAWLQGGFKDLEAYLSKPPGNANKLLMYGSDPTH